MTTPLATVALIADLKRQGATWAQIASAIGAPNGQAAKSMAKKMARAAQADALTEVLAGGDLRG